MHSSCELIFFCLFIFRYVHNNMFFSFAVDSDLEHLPRKQGSEENSDVQSTVSTQNSGKPENNQEQGAFKVSNVDDFAASNTDTVNATEAQPPDVSAESQLAESEQATYASANNDLKGTKAYQEADVPGLYNLAMAIIDYRGHRVVAQVLVYFKLCCSLEFLGLFNNMVFDKHACVRYMVGKKL